MTKKMDAELTTLCYIERNGQYLMLHRTKKKNDPSKDLWMGVGGHFELGESPDECVVREVREETGLTLTNYCLRGIVSFSEGDWHEYMFLYSADEFCGELTECSEGDLLWVDKEKAVNELISWEGDKIFLRLMQQNYPCFSLKLHYENRRLCSAVLNGKPYYPESD